MDNILKNLSRRHLRTIWKKAQAGETLEDEESLLAKIMQQHPEYDPLWAHLDELPDAEIKQRDVNPVLHVQFHLLVENQIAQKNPPEVSQTIKTLLHQGSTRHEAIHAVAAILAEEIYTMLQQMCPFDEKGYLRRLKRLERQ